MPGRCGGERRLFGGVRRRCGWRCGLAGVSCSESSQPCAEGIVREQRDNVLLLPILRETMDKS